MSATPHWICHRCATGNLVHLHERCRLCGHRRESCAICAGPNGSYISPYSRQEREQAKEQKQMEGRSSTQETSIRRSGAETNPILGSTTTSNLPPSRYQLADSHSRARTSDQAQDDPVHTRRQAVNLEANIAVAWVTNNNSQPHVTEDNGADASRRNRRNRDGRNKPDLGAWSRDWLG